MDLGFNDVWSAEASDQAQGLRPLAWAELCARLVAAQDLRREVRPAVADPPHSRGSPASFYPPAAELLQDIAIRPAGAFREEVVNLSLSGNGKDDGGTPWTHTKTRRTSPTDSPSSRETP